MRYQHNICCYEVLKVSELALLKKIHSVHNVLIVTIQKISLYFVKCRGKGRELLSHLEKSRTFLQFD